MSEAAFDRDPETDLPVGRLVEPEVALLPSPITLGGQYVILVPLLPAKHGPEIWEAIRGPGNDHLWRYLFDGPFVDQASFLAALDRLGGSPTHLFFAILDRQTERALGWAALMRVEPQHRSLEVGYILYSPALQRTRGATEAMYLLARHIFEDLGYRRYEWKCDSLNAPSRRAALRLGFTYEGTFRQHMVIKGRNRDTAWFSILDCEWPALRARFQEWLDPANFDDQGKQRQALSKLELGVETEADRTER